MSTPEKDAVVLSIIIDNKNDNDSILAGEKITGSILLRAKYETKLQSLRLVIQGKEFTKHTPKDINESTSCIPFRQQKDVVQESITLMTDEKMLSEGQLNILFQL